MVRYVGQINARRIDRDYPHQVEIAIPVGGLGRRLDAMHDFCRGRKSRTRGAGRERGAEDVVRWCFADLADADAFHATFGGLRIMIDRRQPMHRHDRP